MFHELNTYPPQILVIEDDANQLNTIRDYLTRAKFLVRTAVNGWEALKRIKESPLDLIISEMTINDMDGASLREKCLLTPSTRDVPFLFIVDAKQTDSQVRALRSGVDDVITKPFDPVVLVAHVQAAIERRHSYDRMVRIDPMTRLLNRPTLEKELNDELDRVKRYNRFASMMVMDVDNLNSVNMENGVALGDLLLTCLSGIVLTTIRTMDIAGRYRGAMFLLFLPETDKQGAAVLAGRIQRQLLAVADTVAGVELTFSAGIVSIPDDGTEIRELFTRCEHALKKAKEAGPGNTVFWDQAFVEELESTPILD